MKIGVGMIVKNEEKDLPRCLESLTGLRPDFFVLVDTGSTDRTQHVFTEWAKRNVSFISMNFLHASERNEMGEWMLWDFAKARNVYVDVLDPKVDWILWMDADDVLLDASGLRAKLLGIESRADVAGLKIKSGGSEFVHHRLWRTKRGVRYEGVCHEYPAWDVRSRVVVLDHVIEHVYDEKPGQESGVQRNLRILQREYDFSKEHPSHRLSTRSLFYFANTLRDARRYEEAVRIYNEYLERAPSYHDEMVMARLYLARCHRWLWNHKQAFKVGFETLSIDQRFAEVWLELAQCFFDCGEFEDAKMFAEKCLRMKVPFTAMFIEQDAYSMKPLRMLTDIYGRSIMRKAGMSQPGGSS